MRAGLAGGRRTKLQSAMEYLMTYGWAILIIAVILGSLFQLGVFSAGSLTGNSCIALSGFLCLSPTLVTSGAISFIFGEQTGAPLYNVEFACAGAAASTGLPNPLTAFNSISATGSVLPPSQTGNTIVNGQTMTISSLPCYASSGSALGSSPIGSQFSGYIWVNYTSSSAAENPATNPWLTVKAITLRIKVV